MPNVVAEGQFEIVSQLIRRQDEAITELDLLNSRVESAINELTAVRAAEILEATGAESTESEIPVEPLSNVNEQATKSAA